MEKGEGMKWSGMEWNGLANYNLSNRDDTLTGKNNLPLRDWEGGGQILFAIVPFQHF